MHRDRPGPIEIRVAAGLNPCWPYRDVTVTGRQRMMEQSDVPSIMNMSVAADAESRVAEIARWRELGLDRLVCAAPGIADTDESLHELVGHLALAGIPLSPTGSPDRTTTIRPVRSGLVTDEQ